MGASVQRGRLPYRWSASLELDAEVTETKIA
jgi:hypothetical protein